MVTTERMLERRQRAKELRAQGMTYKKIGEEIGVSGTMARHYVNGQKTGNDRAAQDTRCKIFHNGQRCARDIGHRGIHLSDNGGRLIYWE